jgi:hypothetical protein
MGYFGCYKTLDIPSFAVLEFWTQGLELARQVRYHLSHDSSSSLWILFKSSVLADFLWHQRKGWCHLTYGKGRWCIPREGQCYLTHARQGWRSRFSTQPPMKTSGQGKVHPSAGRIWDFRLPAGLLWLYPGRISSSTLLPLVKELVIAGQGWKSWLATPYSLITPWWGVWNGEECKGGQSSFPTWPLLACVGLGLWFLPMMFG